jgi:hypothetical protein
MGRCRTVPTALPKLPTPLYRIVGEFANAGCCETRLSSQKVRTLYVMIKRDYLDAPGCAVDSED